jgi:hypothetical protein
MLLIKNIEILFPAAHGRPTYRLRRVISCVVESSWESLTDTCEIKISRNIKGMSLGQVRETFRRGDKVEVRFGYNGQLPIEFNGYIIDVEDSEHLVFKCQDEMYKLKSGTVNYNKKNCNLQELLTVIAPGYVYDAADAELGNVRIKDISPSQVLQEIKDGYGIYTYFRDGVLISGKINQGSAVRYVLNYDKDRNIKAHSLTYKRAEDVRAKVKVSSVLRSGQKLEVTVGDADGNQSEIELFGITNMADLKAKAEAKLAVIKSDGFEGDVTLFGIPKVRFGDEVELRSALHPERNGAHYIDATTCKYVTGSGIERVIKIGLKAS